LPILRCKIGKRSIICAPEQAIDHGTTQNEGRITITNLLKRPIHWNRWDKPHLYRSIVKKTEFFENSVSVNCFTGSASSILSGINPRLEMTETEH
jgi:hypothetical protein